VKWTQRTYVLLVHSTTLYHCHATDARCRPWMTESRLMATDNHGSPHSALSQLLRPPDVRISKAFLKRCCRFFFDTRSLISRTAEQRPVESTSDVRFQAELVQFTQAFAHACNFYRELSKLPKFGLDFDHSRL